MAKNDAELFDRLRRAGLRKQVAKSLSEIGEGATKKVQRTALGAARELRALADEIERRMPDASNAKATGSTRARTTRATPAGASRPRRAATAGGARRTAGARGAKSGSAKPASGSKAASQTRRAKPADG